MSALATTRAGAGKTEQWGTPKTIAAVERCTPRAIRIRIQRENWRSRNGEAKGSNGKPTREYLPPVEIQHKLMNAALALVARPAEGPTPQHRLLSELPDDDRKKYEDRRAAAMLMAQLQQEEGLSQTKAAEIAAERIGKSASFCLDWSRDFSKGGLAKLMPPVRRSDYRKQRRLAPKVREFLVYKYTVERIANVSLLHEILVREWANLGVKGKPLSRGTVNTFIYGDKSRGIPSAIPTPAKTLALKGPRAWSAQNAPFIQRERPRPGSWFVADTRTLDIACRATVFPTLKRDEMFRLDCVALVDWGSLAWIGVCLGPQGSSRMIFSALRMAIIDYGFPENFLWDRGKDYASVARALQGEDDEFGERMQSMLKTNGVEFGITRALPYNAPAKMIEAMFSGMSDRFDPIWGAAYLGRSPAHRSEYNIAAQKQHKKYLEGKAAASPLPADAEVIAGAVKWMMEKENNRPRRELGGRTPSQVLEEQWAATASSRKPVDRRLLDVLFCERDVRKLMRGGCVQLDNRRYEPKDEYLAALDLRQGQQVIVLRDPYCLEEAVALDSEALEVIGELRLQDFVAQSPNGHLTRDQIHAAMRRKSGLKRMYGSYLAFHAALADAEGWTTEREILLRNGTDGRELPAGAAPGASEPRKISAPAPRPALGPVFSSDVSDAPEDLSKLEMEK